MDSGLFKYFYFVHSCHIEVFKYKRYTVCIFYLQRYPDCISQAVYHSFFIAYPTSYQQFGEDFKTGVCNFVHLWLTGFLGFLSMQWVSLITTSLLHLLGIQPVPRFWLTWNFGVLEPVNMYKIVADQEKSKENELVKARSEMYSTFTIWSDVCDYV